MLSGMSGTAKRDARQALQSEMWFWQILHDDFRCEWNSSVVTISIDGGWSSRHRLHLPSSASSTHNETWSRKKSMALWQRGLKVNAPCDMYACAYVCVGACGVVHVPLLLCYDSCHLSNGRKGNYCFETLTHYNMETNDLSVLPESLTA